MTDDDSFLPDVDLSGMLEKTPAELFVSDESENEFIDEPNIGEENIPDFLITDNNYVYIDDDEFNICDNDIIEYVRDFDNMKTEIKYDTLYGFLISNSEATNFLKAILRLSMGEFVLKTIHFVCDTKENNLIQTLIYGLSNVNKDEEYNVLLQNYKSDINTIFMDYNIVFNI